MKGLARGGGGTYAPNKNESTGICSQAEQIVGNGGGCGGEYLLHLLQRSGMRMQAQQIVVGEKGVCFAAIVVRSFNTRSQEDRATFPYRRVETNNNDNNSNNHVSPRTAPSARTEVEAP